MAKCIKMYDGHYGGMVVRVPDKYARELVGADRAEYSAKEDWKNQAAGRVEPKRRV